MNKNDEIEELDNLIDEIEQGDTDSKKSKTVEIKEDINNTSTTQKEKKGKDWWLNRIMAGGGILIAGFTLFYVITFYGLFSGGNTKSADETTEVAETEPQTTTDDTNYNVFESPYSDANIAESVKTLLNNATAGESLITGVMSVDNKISSISRSTIGTDMTQYEKVRNVYDYMLYNFRKKNSNAIDEDDIDDLCGGLSFKSKFDMQIAYRADRILSDFSGTSGDYASAFALIIRKMGLEAYYVDDEIENSDGYAEHGYSVVKIDGKYYVFDIASEIDEMDETSNDKNSTDKKKLDYKYFCMDLNSAGTDYTLTDVEAAVGQFENFATLPAMSFETMISNGSHSVFGSVTHRPASYSDGNADMAEGELYVSMGDTVNLAGTVTSTGGNNKWRLNAKIYDRNMNYLNEYEIYNQTTASAYNEVSFTATEGGYVQLHYSVTDIYDRTCIITHMFKIWTADDYTTQQVTEPTTDNPETSSQTESNTDDTTKKTDKTETETVTEKESETTTKPEKETTTKKNNDKKDDKKDDETESKDDEPTKSNEDETTSEQKKQSDN